MHLFAPLFTRRARAGLSAFLITLICALVALPFAAPAPARAAGTTYYVRDGASGSTCASWADACNSLQDALAKAADGDEIWVAAGVYYPDEGTGQSDNDRTSTLQLKADVAIYGGFAGDETSRDNRDWEANLTILSGDIDHDTNPDTTDASGIVNDTANIAGSNAYNVVTGADDATLDGFTITAGSATGSYPDNLGGGMYNYGSSPTLTNVTFSGNSAHYGGGMYNDNSSPTLTNVTFSGNTANSGHPAHSGGGMFSNNSSPTLTNVTFSGNSANFGGGMNNESSNPVLTNVAFSGNEASNGGGMYNYKSTATLNDVIFSGNIANLAGGGMLSNNSSPTLTNATFSGNIADYGGGMYNASSSLTLTNATFSGNIADYGGGMYNHYSDPVLTNVTFSGNQATDQGGGMYNVGSSPTIQNSIIWGNAANNGIQVFNNNSTPTYNYSLVQGLNPGGTGNLDGTDAANDPLFIDPQPASEAPTTAGDYRLQPTSPAIDAGDNSADPDPNNSPPDTMNDITTDLGGYARIVNGTVDLGAYEAGPELHITKTVDQTNPVPGDTIQYTLTISNDGELTTSTALISDTLPSSLTFVGGSLEINGTPENDPTLPTLADGVSVLTTTDTVITFAASVDAALVGGTVITNTASVISTEDATLISSSAVITTVAAAPAIAVSVTPSTSSAAVGDEITYTYRITNTGNTTLEPVDVEDAFGSVTLSTSSLAPGAEATGSTSYTVQESDLPGPLANSVTATGTPLAGEDVSATASASVTLSSSPDLTVSVTPSTDSAEVGEEITYSYQVRNTGNVTLSDVSATDDTFGSIISGETLAPGAEATGSTSYTVLASDLPGPLANSVTATGTPPAGEDVSATASASVEVTETSSGGNNPPTITSVFTSEVQARGVMLHASVNPNGLATTVSFAWGTTPGGPYPNTQDASEQLTGTQVQTASLSLSGLTPDTSYYYIVTATNADGSVTSGEQSFTTPAVEGNPAYGSTPDVGSTLDMGTVQEGDSGTVSLAIREVGSAALVVDLADPAISGADAASFRIEAPASFPITIADGADAVTLSVVCTPQRNGTHSATLTLTTNDAELPTVNYPLTCTGEASEPVDTGITLYLPLIAR